MACFICCWRCSSVYFCSKCDQPSQRWLLLLLCDLSTFLPFPSSPECFYYVQIQTNANGCNEISQQGFEWSALFNRSFNEGYAFGLTPSKKKTVQWHIIKNEMVIFFFLQWQRLVLNERKYYLAIGSKCFETHIRQIQWISVLFLEEKLFHAIHLNKRRWINNTYLLTCKIWIYLFHLNWMWMQCKAQMALYRCLFIRTYLRKYWNRQMTRSVIEHFNRTKCVGVGFNRIGFHKCEYPLLSDMLGWINSGTATYLMQTLYANYFLPVPLRPVDKNSLS